MSEGARADLELILKAAATAGEMALVRRTANLHFEAKADGSPVSEADLAIDRWLCETLTAARPGYGWLSEETVDHPDRMARERLFIVDPIDGTRDYLRGRPWWGVSIAVVEAGRPIAGVVFAPDRKETFAAAVGEGARLNGVPIQASAAEALEGAVMIADRRMIEHPDWPIPWPAMRLESRNSVAYRLCAVACGAADAALVMSAKCEWDLAAADLIAREAGCVVTDHKGGPIAYNRPAARQPSLICAAPGLHRLILQRVEHIELAP
jgi:myo-inositol-1(or 4)-monophosphatase